MTTALFPVNKHARLPTTTPIKIHLLPGLLTDFACVATDAEDSLELFSSLCRNDSGSSSTPGFMAFDAHVGDTSCQIRAGMFMTLYNYLKQHESSDLWHRIEHTIRELAALLVRIRELYQKLTMDKVKMQALGLRPGGETRRHVLEVLGWKEPRNQPTSIHPIRFQSEKDSLSVTIEDITTAETTVLSEPGNSESWDPSDVSQVVRLITYSYVLSKYKSFRRREKAVGTQLDPSLPLGVGARVMADVKNEAYHVWSQPARVARDFESMQNWVSELSFSWLKTMAAGEFGSDSMMMTLLDKTMRKSGKGLTSVPSYVGWLTIRQVMVRTSTPVLLLVKRFCDKGFHTNYFLAKLEDTSPDRSKRGPDFTGANSGIAWHLTQVSANELMTSNNLKPHLTIYGSSLDGTIEDYMTITSQPVHRHHDVNCPQNIEHCRQFLATNHDDIGFSIMAEHRHYAFPVTDEAGRDEVEIVADIMDDVIPGLSVHWRKQKDEAFAIGTCRSFKTFMWQHVLLETVGRAAALLAASDGVLPISAPIALQ